MNTPCCVGREDCGVCGAPRRLWFQRISSERTFEALVRYCKFQLLVMGCAASLEADEEGTAESLSRRKAKRSVQPAPSHDEVIDVRDLEGGDVDEATSEAALAVKKARMQMQQLSQQQLIGDGEVDEEDMETFVLNPDGGLSQLSADADVELSKKNISDAQRLADEAADHIDSIKEIQGHGGLMPQNWRHVSEQDAHTLSAAAAAREAKERKKERKREKRKEKKRAKDELNGESDREEGPEGGDDEERKRVCATRTALPSPRCALAAARSPLRTRRCALAAARSLPPDCMPSCASGAEEEEEEEEAQGERTSRRGDEGRRRGGL